MKWKAVILKEISAIEHATVPLPEGSSIRAQWLENERCQVLPMKLVYTVKPPQIEDASPNAEKCRRKARIVFCGKSGRLRSVRWDGAGGGGTGSPYKSSS